MRNVRRIIVIALLCAFITTFLDVPILSYNSVTQAASIKISSSKLVILVGQTKTLKVSGTTKKATWSSSKKTVATVTSNGKVTAVAAGNANITAKIGDNKFTCTVTVTKSNPYLTNAPFKVEETKIADLNFVIPSNWGVYNQDLADDYIYTEITPPSESNLSSIIKLEIRKQDSTITDYNLFKEAFSGTYTVASLTPEWKEVFSDTKFKIIDFKQSDFKAPFHNVLKTQYTVKADGPTVKQTIYDFFIDDYFVTLKATDYDTIDLATMADYIVSSFIRY